jgi:hypothetical protein
MAIEVTTPTGEPVEGARVTLSGPVERAGRSDAKGTLGFTGLRAGTYRLRFVHDDFETLERDVTIAAATRQAQVDVVLTPRPPKPPEPPPPPPPPPEPARPVGEPSTTDVPAFAERNFIGRSEPQKISIVGCTGYATVRILQVRDPLEGRTNPAADETLYVVAGEAMVRLAGNERVLAPGMLVVIPRGTASSIERRGRNPVILISVQSGPACPDAR